MPGIIESYVHTGNCLGVLVEVGCQTDAAAQTAELKALAKNIALQVAACPKVKYVKLVDVPAEVTQQIKSIEMNREDLSNKPAYIKKKIVQERGENRLNEMCLLEQSYIRDQTITVQDLIKLCSTQLSENIQVRRFVRFRVDDFSLD